VQKQGPVLLPNLIYNLAVSPCTPINDFLHPIVLKKTILPLLKMTSKLLFPEYFWNIIYETYEFWIYHFGN